ncbi:MAG: hypothetical protein ACI8UG_000587 [Gammaproteobacteria bacterium]|jgi:hypothetical protein
MRFFDGFSKKDLIIGTSGFYAATLALIFMSMLLNQYLPFRKSSEFHKRNNLKASGYVTTLQPKNISTYKHHKGSAQVSCSMMKLAYRWLLITLT